MYWGPSPDSILIRSKPSKSTRECDAYSHPRQRSNVKNETTFLNSFTSTRKLDKQNGPYISLLIAWQTFHKRLLLRKNKTTPIYGRTSWTTPWINLVSSEGFSKKSGQQSTPSPSFDASQKGWKSKDSETV